MKKLIFISLLIFSQKLFSFTACHVERSRDAVSVSGKKPNPLRFKFLAKQVKRKKIIATLLAFPIPFGILGLHRIYLGTKPYVPLVYIGTIGGVLILPFVDFCVLLLDKDISRFENNEHIFMWIDNENKIPVKVEEQTETK